MAVFSPLHPVEQEDFCFSRFFLLGTLIALLLLLILLAVPPVSAAPSQKTPRDPFSAFSEPFTLFIQ
jgi:hypothetical protein